MFEYRWRLVLISKARAIIICKKAVVDITLTISFNNLILKYLPSLYTIHENRFLNSFDIMILQNVQATFTTLR